MKTTILGRYETYSDITISVQTRLTCDHDQHILNIDYLIIMQCLTAVECLITSNVIRFLEARSDLEGVITGFIWFHVRFSLPTYNKTEILFEFRTWITTAQYFNGMIHPYHSYTSLVYPWLNMDVMVTNTCVIWCCEENNSLADVTTHWNEDV